MDWFSKMATATATTIEFKETVRNVMKEFFIIYTKKRHIRHIAYWIREIPDISSCIARKLGQEKPVVIVI